ncbi:tetraacyldisaccharide 4'-kinase [Maribacter hydrothermalis]|uniref:Tetraacyldisaccharide 4'-kinase n=1 Tax=Maribacter hydrothermalis TaxID=1836467 RepID=A0A1B7ZBF9_9FLAO|nr:tetraacyldisaccharide 4'-kinase [Maribacter hydrothermalis]APQ16487.1 tetraacyldisaccharide 4'-kinase [Maribacter hydrothermalis]OBR40051.1 tetraacyldisaccharide 4'-kinase [Maribacter hydrothermalis]
MQVLRKLLFPISIIYGLIVFLRNRCYDLGVFKSKTYATKIICVGNLSVGGTGKTPMIEWLVRLLQDNYSIAILSRGYKRKSKGFLLSDDNTIVEDLGDEPFQLKSKFKGIHVAVDANRRNGISELEKMANPDIILLDDAFQHRKVKPDYSILLSAYNNLYVNDWYLPTGNLRDAKSEAKRANIIIVTKCPEDLPESKKSSIRSKINPKRHQKVLFSYLSYNKKLKGKEIDLSELINKEVTLVTGIANSVPLENFLQLEGVTFNHLKFNDHHFFTEQEIQLLQKKECILTTEKDYVRLKSKISNLHYIEVSHEFNKEDRLVFEQTLKQFMTANS